MATAPAYTAQGFKTTFRAMSSDVQQGSVAGKFAAQRLGAKTIAVIDDRTAYGQGLADQFDAAASDAGARVVGREFTDDKSTDISAILTRLKSLKPELV